MTLSTEDIKTELENIRPKLDFDFSTAQILELVKNIKDNSEYSPHKIEYDTDDIDDHIFKLEFKNSADNSIMINIRNNIVHILNDYNTIKIPLFVYNKIVIDAFEKFHNDMKIDPSDIGNYDGDFIEQLSKAKNARLKTENDLKNICIDMDKHKISRYTVHSTGYQYFYMKNSYRGDTDSDSSTDSDDSDLITENYKFGIYKNEIILHGMFYTRKTNYDSTYKIDDIYIKYRQIKNDGDLHTKLEDFVSNSNIEKIVNHTDALIKKLNLQCIDIYYKWDKNNPVFFIYSYPDFDSIHDPIDIIYIEPDIVIVNDDVYDTVEKINILLYTKIILSSDELIPRIDNNFDKHSFDRTKIVLLYKGGKFDSFYDFALYKAKDVYQNIQKTRSPNLEDFIIINQ